MRSLSKIEAADVLGISPRSLADRRYRNRIGLPARRIGRRLVFLESDCRRLLELGKERLVKIGERPALEGDAR